MSAFDQLEKAEQISGQGSGGDIAKIVVLLGWKVFVSGLSNAESFVPFNSELEGDSKKKYAEAQKLLPVGSDKKPTVAVRFITLKNSVLNRDVSTWKGDRIEDVQTWTDSYKKVVKPANEALKAAGKSFELDKPFWARKSYAPDPTGRMKENYKKGEEGQPDMVPDLVPFIAEIYASESEARAAAAERSAGAGANSNGNSQQQELSDDPIAQYEASPEDLKELRTKLMTAAKGVKALPKATFDERVNSVLIGIGQEEIADDEEYLTGNLPKLRQWAGLAS